MNGFCLKLKTLVQVIVTLTEESKKYASLDIMDAKQCFMIGSNIKLLSGFHELTQILEHFHTKH